MAKQDDALTAELEDGVEGEEETQPLELQVQVESPSACERHISVSVSRGDIDRYLDDAIGEMMPMATVPGFRAGRAPRKLVEQRFKSELGEQVKGKLLMDSLTQISEEQKFAAISDPDFDLEAVELPDEGPMTFEFDVEVRPEFELPEWRGLKLNRPVREFSEADIDEHLEGKISRYGQLVPSDDPAAEGDYVTVNTVARVDGEVVARDEERMVRVRPVLSFSDGRIEDFAKSMVGAKAGDKKTFSVKLTHDAPNAELRGKEVEVEFDVLEVKKLKLPELDEEFLGELGGYKTEEEFREALKLNLSRQLEYEQGRIARRQITALLVESADWELPPGLLKRQSSRELERAVMELRRAGFSEAAIRARENELRQNSGASTAAALKEHFILERIAEDQNLDVDEGDYDAEIMLMSMQSGESPRRVRAQLEKRGLMDILRNQVIERKVLELVQSQAKFKDEPYELPKNEVEAIPVAAGGRGAEAIPEAHEDQGPEEPGKPRYEKG
ncbi:Trigger factor [Pirellulimonas nuda]|uniref:Trigger factor n=1 Tax=Pirellulimonas nuda TaxID=2528009 RepID=A0A518DIG1_9BACT|nr:trigger factor [Pirellulimonas nuda]QDU91270.1 Trigger factor [Pirellulimonas nuda]